MYKRETAATKPGADALRWDKNQAGSNCPSDEQLLIPLGKSSMGFADLVMWMSEQEDNEGKSAARLGDRGEN